MFISLISLVGCNDNGEVVGGEEKPNQCEHMWQGHESKSATCTEDGIWVEICSKCGETNEENIPSLGGHIEVIDSATNPTCTKTGLTEGKHCSVCNTVLVTQEEVDALGHNEVVDNAIEATCTEPGLTEGKHCSVCNEVLVSQQTVAALGHDEINHDSVEPTCTVTGNERYVTCSRCDYTTYEEIAALGHIESEWVIDKEPTEDLDGSKHRSCIICNKIIFVQVIPGNSNGLAYSINDDGKTCEIIGIGTCVDAEIGIPSIIDGYTVTAIADKAFYEQTQITYIIIPNTVTSIGNRAFYGCTGLVKLQFRHQLQPLELSRSINLT